jgi:hypothetical protein
MNKRTLLCSVVLLLVVGFAVAGDKDKSGSWTGVVTDDHCGFKAKHSADCVNGCVKNHGAKYVLADSTDKKLYVLEPQDQAAAHANETVKITGTVDGNTIKITKIEAAPAK